MSMLKDQKDLLSVFNAEGVEYLVIGGHAVGMHAEPRATKDLDVFIRNDADNAERVFRALKKFGAPLGGLSAEDFCGQPDTYFQVGVPPSRIDVVQSISGVTFEKAWANRVMFTVDGELKAPFIALDELITNKIASGRLQDLADAEKLNKMKDI